VSVVSAVCVCCAAIGARGAVHVVSTLFFVVEVALHFLPGHSGLTRLFGVAAVLPVHAPHQKRTHQTVQNAVLCDHQLARRRAGCSVWAGGQAAHGMAHTAHGHHHHHRSRAAHAHAHAASDQSAKSPVRYRAIGRVRGESALSHRTDGLSAFSIGAQVSCAGGHSGGSELLLEAGPTQHLIAGLMLQSSGRVRHQRTDAADQSLVDL
jgi:hypothetical protein